MSSRQRRRQFKTARKHCVSCEARKALFRYRGEVRADRDHTLCFECYRAEMNRARSRRLGEGRRGDAFVPRVQRVQAAAAAGRPSLPGQTAHRQRMLDHLCRQAAIM